MSDDKTPDGEEIFKRIIDGGPIVSTAQKAAGSFFESAFKRLDKQVEEIFTENTIDRELASVMRQMTKDLIGQLEARLDEVFKTSDQPDPGKAQDPEQDPEKASKTPDQPATKHWYDR